MRSLLNKIKSEKKTKSKNIDKIKQLEIELVEINFANNPVKLQSESKEINKIHVVNKTFHEIKNETLLGYTGEFEMIGDLSIVDHIRFRNITDYEHYFNAIDQVYESEDAICNGYNYKINTLQFNLVNRSQYGNGCDFKHEIFEYRGNNGFLPTKSYCFVKCFNYLTGEDYNQQYLDFIRKEKKTIKCYD